jgi:hypothetical protein
MRNINVDPDFEFLIWIFLPATIPHAVMSKNKVIVFEGKRYPRYWGEVWISLSEAMARMGAQKYERCHGEGAGSLIIHANITDAPEGINRVVIGAEVIHQPKFCDPDLIRTYSVRKESVDMWLAENNRPLCDD